MILQITDRAALSIIKPTRLEEHLRARQWELVGRNDFANVWGRDEDRILVPRGRHFDDYARRMAEALDTLARADRVSQLEILHHLDIRTHFFPQIRSNVLLALVFQLGTIAALSAMVDPTSRFHLQRLSIVIAAGMLGGTVSEWIRLRNDEDKLAALGAAVLSGAPFLGATFALLLYFILPVGLIESLPGWIESVLGAVLAGATQMFIPEILARVNSVSLDKRRNRKRRE